MAAADKTCPNCGSEDVAQVVYGLPTPEAEERARNGELRLKGCLRPPDPDDWACNDCGHEWQSQGRSRWR